MAQQEIEVHQFFLNITVVKMTVKFQCKMKLEYNGAGLTSEVSSNEAQKFLFNQQATLKQETQKPYFQISVNLITEKGGKYIAGIIKLFHNELARSEGQKLVVPVGKCLDSEAFCEVKVNRVNKSKQFRKGNTPIILKSRMTFDYPRQNQLTNHKLKPAFNTGETKSELQFPINTRRPKQEWQELKNKNNIAHSYYNRNIKKSPNRLSAKLKSQYEVRQEAFQRSDNLGRNEFIKQTFDIDKDKFIEAEVYKQGYNKLKEKYKKQAENAKTQLNKRINLESIENNLKLQIMRLKMKTQEQQKAMNEKNIKIKQLQNQISNYQKKELDIGYLRQEINNKDHSIKIIQENIRTLTRNNQELKELNHQIAVSEQEKAKQLKRQIQILRQKSQAKETEFEQELKAKLQIVYTKQAELLSKNQMILRQKKTVEQLERQSQNKSLQFERTLQNQKAMSRSKIDDLKLKIEKMEKNLLLVENQRSQTQSDLQKVKSIQVKLQYENRVFMQQIDSLKTELAGVKTYKDKYAEIFRDHKLLADDNNHLQKQLQRAHQSKEMSTTELNKQHIQQVEYFRKANKQLEERQRNLSNKVVELEGLQEASKNGQQKLKRTLQSITIELNQTKQREKLIKKTLKSKQQQAVVLENELITIKQKSKSAQQFLKHELQKYKEQLQKFRNDFQNLSMKNNQLNEQNGHLSIELGKVRVKLQFTQEKVEKDGDNIKEKKLQIENITKDFQAQIKTLNQTIQGLRMTEKELIAKIQNQEIQGLRSHQKIERLVKQIKIIEEKHSFAQSLLKNRQSESSVLQTGKKDLQLRIYKLEEEISCLKGQQSQLLAQRNKNQKVNELMQEDNLKLRKQNERLKHMVEEYQRNTQEHLSEIKKVKQELTKTQIKLANTTKDFQRFKELTMEGITNSFGHLVPQKKDMTTFPTTIRKTSMEMGSSKNLTTSTEINNLINNYCKQTKITISKLSEQNKHLSKENEKLQQQLAGNINRGQTSQYQYAQQIQNIQAELSNSYAVRDEQGIRYDHILKDLNARIRNKERQLHDLNGVCDDLNFKLNSSKLEYDSQMEQQSKKSSLLKSKIIELQDKIEFLNINIINMEERIHDKQMENEGIRGVLRAQKENGARKDRIISQLRDRRDQLQEQVEEGKKYRKDLFQKNSTLEMILNTEREQLEKTRQLLDQEEQKGMELRTFIGSLMKQKQAVIKTQLQKSQHIISLESKILELTRDRDILAEDNMQISKQLDESKQAFKKITPQIKDIQSKYNEERVKNQKMMEKIKEKEKQVLIKQQSIQKLEAKIFRQTERGQKQGSELREELQSKTQEFLALTRQHNEKCFQFQKEKHSLQSTVAQLKIETSQMEQQIFNLKHSQNTRVDQINSLNGEISSLRAKIDSLQRTNYDLTEEIRQTQETAFQLSGKLHNLQMKLESKQIQKNERISAIDNDWIGKYELMCEEYELKIGVVEKERDYYKDRMHDEVHEVNKITNEKNVIQIEENKMRGILEQKIRQLEKQRLNIITQKNIQIQKINEENKIQFESLKVKQSQTRKNLHEVEVLKGTVNKLELKNKELDDKMKNINRIYQAQIDQLKKKDTTYKNFKESINNKIWNSEREVRRLIQSFIKKGIEAFDDSQNSHRFIEAMKGFQLNVADAMKIHLDQTS